MKFIDLFAGLGGFHLALKKLGHQCVFACEIKETLANLYKKNFGIDIKGDIRRVKPKVIPNHDILCAGFPCQPFSKAGQQKGMKDEKNGALFFVIADILKFYKPKYFLLENVPHIRKHDNERTWRCMVSVLEDKLKYKVDHKVYSPHEFGIPQHRKRIFIVGARDGLEHFTWPKPNTRKAVDVKSILDRNASTAKKLGKQELRCLKIWQDFIVRIPKEEKLGYPIWSMEFDATYPFEKTTPSTLRPNKLSKYLGSFGASLKGLSKNNQLSLLPSYARVEEPMFPKWKQDYIKQNRKLFKKYRTPLKPVISKIKLLKVPSWQKFEWTCQNDERIIMNHIIQFRASGIRAKKTDFFPSLVCTPTQIPIVGWEKRYISKKEGALLQSIKGIKLPEEDNICFRALGNAVNVKIVYLIAKALINER